MKKILFATNVPSPYRVDFFNELGKYCDLTVCYERTSASDRDRKWMGGTPVSFEAVALNLKPYKEDRSFGNALASYIKNNKFDVVILTNYVSPATISAIIWCKRHHKPYYIEYDGGFNKKDRFFKFLLKKYLLCHASGHFTTCEEHKKYLLSIGITEEKIYKYPFSSISSDDLKKASALSNTSKKILRDTLSVSETKMVLSVGQFIYRKGFDILLKTAASLDKDIGIYIVGGQPTEEYLEMRESLSLTNVHFVGFKTKDELAMYYAAADLFVLPTREDIWGLVINEAMAYSLPIVSTDKCIAALELVEPGYNGYILPVGDEDKLADSIHFLLQDVARCQQCGRNSRNRIQSYTIEEMAKRHMEIFEDIQSKKQ